MESSLIDSYSASSDEDWLLSSSLSSSSEVSIFIYSSILLLSSSDISSSSLWCFPFSFFSIVYSFLSSQPVTFPSSCFSSPLDSFWSEGFCLKIESVLSSSIFVGLSSMPNPVWNISFVSCSSRVPPVKVLNLLLSWRVALLALTNSFSISEKSSPPTSLESG
jgi:hypothetical protein